MAEKVQQAKGGDKEVMKRIWHERVVNLWENILLPAISIYIFRFLKVYAKHFKYYGNEFVQSPW